MTRGRLTVAPAVVLALALCLPWTPPAAATTAEKRARIVDIVVADDVLEIVFQTDGLAAGELVDPRTVVVEVDGQPTAARAKRVPFDSPTVTRTAVLAIDNSRSMAGGRLDSAKAAAKVFVESLPDDVTIGLVTFADDAEVVVENTPVRDSVLAAIDRIVINDTIGTALFDAVALASDETGGDGPRSVLLLTDGNEDGSSDLTLEEAADHATDDGVTVDAVFIGEDGQTQPPELVDLVGSAGGRVVSSQPDELADVFEKAAQAISSQLLVTASLPADAAAAGNVQVSARAGDTIVTDTAFKNLEPTAPSERDPDLSYGPRAADRTSLSALTSSSALPFLLAALFAGLMLLLYVVLGTFNRDDVHGRLRRRLSAYTLSGRSTAPADAPVSALGTSQVARSAVELAGRMVQPRDFEERLALRLEAAGVPLRAAEWMLIHTGIAVGAGLLALLLSGGSILPTVLGLALGLGLPMAYLVMKETRRTSAFLAQLPDTLQLVAGSLSAGYSVPQAMDTVVREGSQPITGEFNRALVEARLGVPIEDALDGVAERMQSKDFGWVVMAIRIQREVGGNLAELLTTVAATLRERDRLRRQVSVLSAEGRLSAWILGLLPLVFAGYLLVVQPEYLSPLVTSALGWLLIGLGVTLLTVGAVWMRKVVRVEV